MKLKATPAGLALTVTALAGATGTGTAAPATQTHAGAHAAVSHHACTRTSSGSCIRCGEFCKQSQYGQSGYDARGRCYVCTGDHTHPTGKALTSQADDGPSDTTGGVR